MRGMRLHDINEMARNHMCQGTPHNQGIDRSKDMMMKKKEMMMKEAMKHSNKVGAGAKKRKHLKGQEKVGVVMREFYRGTLHSGSGKIVPKNRPDIAKAIAMSEAGLSKKGGKRHGKG